jgi:nucleoid-associated protein YgaU
VIPWLLSGGLGLVGTLLVLLYRSRLERAKDNVELWRTQSGRLTSELHDQAASFLDERKRLEGTIRVLQQQRAEAHRRTAELADADPARYVRDQLRATADAFAPDPGPHAEVSGPTASEPADGRGRGSG